MNTMSILLLLLLVSVIVYQTISIINLIIPTKKRNSEILIVIIGSIILLMITYFYANKWYNYLLGILASITLILNLYKCGITSKGFSYSAGYTGALVSDINWAKIKRIKINQGKYIILDFTENTSFVPGDEYKLFFDKSEYKKIITILKENLPSQKIILND